MEDPQNTVMQLIMGWSQHPKRSTTELLMKHGTPSDVGRNMIIWKDKLPWKEIRSENQEVIHKFPMEHIECCYFTLEHAIPPDKVSELLNLNGSMAIDRTRGTVTLRAENEKMAFLELNYADKLIKGQMQAQEIMGMLASDAKMLKEGKKVMMAEMLTFQPQVGPDPGMSLSGLSSGKPDPEQIQQEVERISEQIKKIGEDIRKAAKT